MPSTRATNGLTSTSLSRAPGPTKNFVRGKSGHVPFWPGGFDDVSAGSLGPNGLATDSKAFRSVAPGLHRGLRLPGDPIEDEELVDIEESAEATSEGNEVSGLNTISVLSYRDVMLRKMTPRIRRWKTTKWCSTLPTKWMSFSLHQSVGLHHFCPLHLKESLY